MKETEIFIHYFICPCGRQCRVITYALHDCPCGISRKYHHHSGLFSETLYRTVGFPSNVYTYARCGDVFLLRPDEIGPTPEPKIPRQVAVAHLRRY